MRNAFVYFVLLSDVCILTVSTVAPTQRPTEPQAGTAILLFNEFLYNSQLLTFSHMKQIFDRQI